MYKILNNIFRLFFLKKVKIPRVSILEKSLANPLGGIWRTRSILTAEIIVAKSYGDKYVRDGFRVREDKKL
tara:strand:+ start:15645 stop:15857 length:213 start_codon:yes stop_codon:yes gene_type:complete